MYNTLNFQGLISRENREEIITKEDVKGFGFLENFDSYCNNQEEDIVPKGSKKPYSFNAGNYPIDSLGKILSFFSHKEHGRFSIISRAVYKRTSTPIFKKLASSLIYLNDKDQKTKAKEFLFSLWVFKEHPDFEDLCKKQLLLYQKYLQIEKLYESLSEDYKTSDQGKKSKQVLEEIGTVINKESKLPEQTLNKIEQHINYKTIEENGKEEEGYDSYYDRHCKKCFLSGLGLTCLPEAWIDEHKELTMLWLERNKLTSLPSTISKLIKLEELWLENNKLTSLPGTVGDLPELDDLSLDGNEFEEFPKCILDIKKLKYLWLGYNKLTSLPGTIGTLKNLTKLDISNNKLITVPDTLGNLRNIWDLRLNGNKLTTLPGTIGEITGLWLEIRGNPFEWLPKCFKKVVVDMSDDELTLLCDCSLSKTKNAKRARKDIKGSCEQREKKRQKLLEEMPPSEERFLNLSDAESARPEDMSLTLTAEEEKCLIFSAGLTFSCESGEYEENDLSSSIDMQKK